MYRVYAVDDDEMILDDIINGIPWLEYGFEPVGGSTDPAVALVELSALLPELVVCDLKMPGMDGIDFIRAAKKNGVDAEFLMLSAFGSFEDSRSFFLEDGFDYILKPLNMEEVQLVLQKLTRKMEAKNGGAAKPAVAPVDVSGFDEMVAYVTGHYSEKFTLEKLGRQFHLSPGYICNLFAKHYHTTFITFLTDLRMKHAAAKVCDTDESMKKIAVECGYTNYFYFCKQFKAYYGCAPTAYRENSRHPVQPPEDGAIDED